MEKREQKKFHKSSEMKSIYAIFRGISFLYQEGGILQDGFILQRVIKLRFRHYHIIGVVINLIVIMLNVIQVTLRMRCFRLANVVLITP